MAQPSFREAFRFWLKLGFISFGGPAGQIAIMQSELVERRRWIEPERFLSALSYCLMLPGPEAQQLAIYLGWLWHRTLGGLVAGVLFVLPSQLLLVGLSWIYAAHGELAAVQAVFGGLKPVVVAIVAHAVMRLGRRALGELSQVLLAGAAFLALSVFRVPFPFLVLGAALVGILGRAELPRAPAPSAREDAGDAPPHTRPDARRALRYLGVGLALWVVPFGALLGWRGSDDVLTREALFFSKAALVTFGGAYAVLPYIAAHGVAEGWLEPQQMLDGLALGETTPGPLIMVTSFVGFLGGYRQPGELAPAVMGLLGSSVTVYFTFLPCFFFIFIGAPYIEAVQGVRPLGRALRAVMAAVVGVILSLGVMLGEHALLPHGRIDVTAVAIAACSLLLMERYRLAAHWLVLGGACLGLARLVAGGAGSA